MDPLPPPAAAPAPAMPKQGGGGKKWVFLGCGGCLVLIVLGAIAMGGLFVFGIGKMKEAEPYQTALKRSQSSPQVQAALGTPVEAGFLMQGSVSTENGNDAADINFPIKGPKGEATVYVKGNKPAGGTWEYSRMEAVVKGSDQAIDLRSAP